MKVISAALSSLALVSGFEHFDDGSPSLLQLAKRHDASPEIGHSQAHAHHYGYNATKKLSGGNFGCTGQMSTPGDMISCGLWGDVHQHLKFGGGGAANSNGVGWYWLAKSQDNNFQAQAFYRQNGGWTTMSHLVFKFGNQVLFLDRDLKEDKSDGRTQSWMWTYYWRDYPSGQPVERSVNDAPCDVGDVYWANRGRGHLSNQGDFSSFEGRSPWRNNCFEYRPSMVSVWVTYQTWQQNDMGPFGGGIVLELEGSAQFLDSSFGQCAFAQQQVQPDDMLVTIAQNEKVCDDNKLDRSQCTNPPPLPPSPPPEPTAQQLCNTAAQGSAADGAARYEHAQALCAGQPAGDVYESCVYDVCASFDAAAEKLAVGGAALEAAMANDRAVCAVTNAFQNAANCMPCDICMQAPEVNLRHVTQSNLGGVGPDTGAEEIRYSNAICLGGTLVYPADGSAPSCPDGRLLDVALTAIPEQDQQYDLLSNKVSKNGNNGKEPEPFGRFLINSGLESNMKFEFQDSATREAVAVPNIALTFYDMDEAERQYGTAANEQGERVQREMITGCQADQIYVTENTELLQTSTGLCYAFQSNVVGTGQDNPKTPDTLTKTQADRSVTFEYHAKSHIIWTAQVTSGANTPRPILWSFRPQVACGASDSDTTCADFTPERECRATIETGSRTHSETGTGANIQFRVNGEWSQDFAVGPNIAKDQAVTVSGQFTGNADAIKITAGGSDAWGYRRIQLNCPNRMSPLQLLDSPSGEEYGANWYWVDGNQDAPVQQIYEAPRECRATIETSSQSSADTATGAQIQFRVNGGWSWPYSLPSNIAKDQVVSVAGTFHGDADAIRVTAGGGNAWGYRRIELNCNDRITTLLESANGQGYGNNQYWVDGNQEAPASQIYESPQEGDCSATIETGGRTHSDTGTGANIQFRVNGAWSQNFAVGPNIAKDQVVTVSGQFAANADALRITAGGSDAWGYKSIQMNCANRITQLLDSDNGQDYGNNQYWVDGNQDAPASQDYGA